MTNESLTNPEAGASVILGGSAVACGKCGKQSQREKEGEDQGRGQESDVPVRSTEGLLEAEDTAAAHPKPQAPRSRCSGYTRDLGASPW